jgi:hypothetical protein
MLSSIFLLEATEIYVDFLYIFYRYFHQSIKIFNINQYGGSRMKKLFSIIFLSQFFIGCAATHMLVTEKKPELSADPNAATLIIIRDMFLGKGIVVWNYVDGKLIGETKGYTYFISKVQPGKHYLIAESENVTTVQMDFKPNKNYYLRQDIWMGIMRARTGYSVYNPDEAAAAMKKCEFWEYDKNNPGEDLPKEKYEQAIKDYEKDLKKDPKGYQPFLEHPGY